ncbi:MAG TPA: hypothetical protein P5201_16050, partial [Aminobacteriaceae bacterium]|nr:hypothetical protein [Aminobacteriaceae bacterium]
GIRQVEERAQGVSVGEKRFGVLVAQRDQPILEGRNELSEVGGVPHLLRYRTGDRGRFLSGTCRCGSILKRIETTGRLRNGITLHNGVFVPLHELDEALFSIPWLADYSASQEDGYITVSLHAPSREATTPEPAPQEHAALAAALDNLSADAKSALWKRPFRFRFLPHTHDGVSSRKRVAG